MKLSELIRRKVINKNKEEMIILYKTIVRPVLDYCVPVWRPYLKKDVIKLEKVQRNFTKMIKECKGLGYEERLELLGLTTLEERHTRADLIQVYKILHDEDKVFLDEFLVRSTRQGRKNSMKLYKKRCLKDITRMSFTYRVIDVWNNLPELVVSAVNINEFKGRLNLYLRDARGRH